MAEENQKNIPDSIVKRIDEYDRNLDNWSHYDLLYIPRNSDRSRIKRGYYKIVQLMHPDRYGLDLDPDHKAKLERIFNEINVAYNVLMDDEAKAKYDQSLYRAADHNQPLKESNDKVVARAQYNRGIKALKADKIDHAIEFFRSATDLDDEKAEYWAKLAFALAKHRNPRIQKEAVEHCNKAISMQNENANYHALMGFIYQQMNNPEEAKVHYKRALSWDPHHQRSRQEIHKINVHQHEEKRKKSLGYKIMKILKPPQKEKPSQRHSSSRRKK